MNKKQNEIARNVSSGAEKVETIGDLANEKANAAMQTEKKPESKPVAKKTVTKTAKKTTKRVKPTPEQKEKAKNLLLFLFPLIITFAISYVELYLFS